VGGLAKAGVLLSFGADADSDADALKVYKWRNSLVINVVM
jgi:hypothetical protein